MYPKSHKFLPLIKKVKYINIENVIIRIYTEYITSTIVL